MKIIYSTLLVLLYVASFGQVKMAAHPNNVAGNQIIGNSSVAPMAVKSNKASLFSEGFNNTTCPTGWVVEDVSGTAGEITFISTTLHPSGYASPEGTHFVMFNSYSCTAGNSTQLKMTTPTSTTGYSNLSVDFYWFTDNAYSNLDSVALLWSTDGSVWNNAGGVRRYAATTQWNQVSLPLPIGAINQPVIYLSFSFYSAYGNDCHLDNVSINGTAMSANDLAISNLYLNTDADGFFRTGNDTLTIDIVNIGSSLSSGAQISAFDGMTLLGSVPLAAMPSMGSAQVKIPFVANAEGFHQLKVYLPSDDNNVNNADTLSIYMYDEINKIFCGDFLTTRTKCFERDYPVSFIDIGQSGSQNVGGTWANGKYYAINYGKFLVTVDTLTGASDTIGSTGLADNFNIGLAYDWTNQTLYTLGLTGTYPDFIAKLYSVDTTSGVATTVATFDVPGTYLDIAIDLDGNMYGIRHIPGTYGKLVQIDKTMGVITEIADVPASISSYFQEIEYDAENDVLLYVANGYGTDLDGVFIMDKNTAMIARVGTVLCSSVGADPLALAIPYNKHYNVSFTVVDSTNGNPLPYADLFVFYWSSPNTPLFSLTADAFGQVSVSLENGDYIYDAYAVGHYPAITMPFTIAGQDTSILVQLPSGVGFEENMSADISMYPTLSDGNISVSAELDLTIEVMDVTGHLVYSTSIESGKNKLNLSFLTDGIYIVKLSGNSVSRTERILIQH